MQGCWQGRGGLGSRVVLEVTCPCSHPHCHPHCHPNPHADPPPRIPDNAYGIRPWLDSLHGSEVHNLTRELFHYRGQAQQRGKGAGSERAWLPWYDGTPEDYAGDGEWAVMPGEGLSCVSGCVVSMRAWKEDYAGTGSGR